jgi:hypothetical protein
LISVGVQPAPYEAGLEADFVFPLPRLSVAGPAAVRDYSTHTYHLVTFPHLQHLIT